MAMTIDPSNQMGVLPSYEESRRRMQALNAAAAGYLGLSRRELRTGLEAGKSLADLAAEKGKSLDGLRQAMMAADPGTSGNGGINAMGFVDRVIHAHSGAAAEHSHGGAAPQTGTGAIGRPGRPQPKSGPAVDPAPPRRGEQGDYHTLPIDPPPLTDPYQTPPIVNPRPKDDGDYHTLPIDVPPGTDPYQTPPIVGPKDDGPYHTTSFGGNRKGTL
jgi:hypothetical protein